jgi:hypothetical protein
MNKLRKAIAYAYPTSERAAELGAPGYYVEQSMLREDGTWSPPYIAQGCHDVFVSREDADLLALFAEADGEGSERHLLGSDLAGGQRPQAVVPAQAWQSAQSLGDWSLVGCTVAPAFDFAGFEMAPPDWKPGRRSPKSRRP